MCPKCKTPTYIYISPQLEVFLFREDELCPECRGSGKCSKCKGTGKTVCPRCNGAGYIYYEGHYEGNVEYKAAGCTRCGGYGVGTYELYVEESLREGLMKNQIKLGSGKVDCYHCNGTGVCPACGGYRFIVGKYKKDSG